MLRRDPIATTYTRMDAKKMELVSLLRCTVGKQETVVINLNEWIYVEKLLQ